MNKIFLVLIVLLISTVVFGQDLIMKSNLVGDDPEDWFESVVCDSSDNSYVAVGTVLFDATIVKYDSAGNIKWQKKVGGNGDNYLSSVVCDSSDNSYVVVGAERDRIDAIIVKYDTNGNVKWQKNFGGDGEDSFYSVVYDSSDNSYVAVGYSYAGSFGTGDWADIIGKGWGDATIVKFDSAGNVKWKKNFGAYNEDNEFTSVTYDSSDNTYVAVGCNSSVNHRDILIVKYDTNGNVLWQKTPAGLDDKFLWSVTYNSIDNTYVAVGEGNSLSQRGTEYAIIVKYDINGNMLWNKDFTGLYSAFRSVTYDSSDNTNVAVGYCGSNNSGYIIVKFDVEGNVSWGKSFSEIHLGFFRSVVYDSSDNTYVAVGQEELPLDSCVIVKFKYILVVTGITVSPQTLSLSVGSSSVLTATILPSTASNKNVTWSSSNTNVASVDTNGKVTAIAKGSAIITATSADGNKKATCNVTVTVPVTSVTITPKSLSLIAGSSSILIATVLPSTANNKNVIWSSSNTNIADIDANGKVIGVCNGEATITATSADGNKTASCLVTVITPVKGVIISPMSLNLLVGDSSILTATIAPTNATNKDVTWKSSNSNVATIDGNGRVTGKAKGNTTITAITKDGSFKGSCYITVKAFANVINVKMLPTSIYVKKNKTVKVIVKVLPTNATNKEVTWKSSNTEIATVSNIGEIVGLNVGITFVTVTTLDGNKKAACRVTVKN